MNEDIRTKQDLLFEVSSLNTQLSNELIKNEKLQQRIDEAIVYIKQEEWNTEYDNKLLEILRGKDENN